MDCTAGLAGTVPAGADAVVAGLALGGLAFVALAPAVGLDTTLVSGALAYPVLGAPAAYAVNRAVTHRTTGRVSTFGDRVADGAGVYDQATVDRLFVYTRTRDDRLRAAVGALATAVQVEGYRRDEALTVFGRAAESEDGRLARAGLCGIAGVLRDDRSRTTYERLVDYGVPNRVPAGLERDEETRLQAAEAAARVLRVELEATAVAATEQLDSRYVTELCGIAARYPQRGLLVDAVLEYIARLYEDGARRVEANSPVLQELLGSLVELSVYGNDRAALAVTGEETTADRQRFEQAVDAVAADREETRYIATHVVSSSMDRHAGAVDTEQLVAQLLACCPAGRRDGGLEAAPVRPGPRPGAARPARDQPRGERRGARTGRGDGARHALGYRPDGAARTPDRGVGRRDPAVDIDPERPQDASTAIQTGTPVDDDAADSEDQRELWSPQTSDEMGVSGETNVLDPVGEEFEGTFDDEFESDSGATAGDPVADRATSLDNGPGGPGQERGDGPADIGDHDTVIQGGDDAGGSDEADDTDEESGG